MKYLLLIALLCSGCTKTLIIYHYFPDTLYIEEYQLQEWREVDCEPDTVIIKK